MLDYKLASVAQACLRLASSYGCLLILLAVVEARQNYRRHYIKHLIESIIFLVYFVGIGLPSPKKCLLFIGQYFLKEWTFLGL